MKRDDIWYGDALCFVMATNRKKETIYSILNEFAPDHQKIESDYVFNSEFEDMVFENEDSILTFLEENTTVRGTIYWKDKYPHYAMTGAHFTSDGSLILSLTIEADGTKEDSYLADLKRRLQSEIGIIYYNLFPNFINGEKFKALCKEN